jgi:hypothetical protein
MAPVHIRSRDRSDILSNKNELKERSVNSSIENIEKVRDSNHFKNQKQKIYVNKNSLISESVDKNEQ